MKIQTRRLVRTIANSHVSTPVEVVEGNSCPKLVGDSFHYQTLGGTRIWHPSAYSKKGWSNMRYVNSTVRVEVGAKWMKKMGLVSK